MNKGGRVIFTGSVLGERPAKGLSAYSASKAGLVGLAKSLALDLADEGITVNVVAPGWFDSPLADSWTSNERLSEAVLSHTALKRWGTSTDLAGAYLFLASDASVIRHGHGAQRRRRIPPHMSSTSPSTTTPTRVVVVLGAGGALGTAISVRLASELNTDIVLGDVSAASLQASVDATSSPPTGAVESVLADVSDFDQVEAVVNHAVERFGRVDVLVGNAGVLAPNGRIHNLTTDDWQRVIQINLMGAVNTIKAGVAPMRQQGSGSIILTASVAGITAWSHAAPYCATKAAVIQLAKVAAVEYAREGIPRELRVPWHIHLSHP